MTEPRAPLSFLLNSEFREKYPHQLVARYPHIARHIESLWHNADAVADYFSDLMHGIDPNVAAKADDAANAGAKGANEKRPN